MQTGDPRGADGVTGTANATVAAGAAVAVAAVSADDAAIEVVQQGGL